MLSSKEDDVRQVGWPSTPSEGKSKDEEEDDQDNWYLRENGVRLIFADPESKRVRKLCSWDVNVYLLLNTWIGRKYPFLLISQIILCMF